MSAPAYPGVLLRLSTPWTSGEAVVALQERLAELGLAGEADLPAVFGTPTAAAVRSFQRRAGLTEDGVVGRRTWEALFGAASASLPAASPPAASPPAAAVTTPAAPAASTAAVAPAVQPAAASGDGDYARALRFVLKWEGGFVDDPADPGGRTNKGVTFRVYDAWRKAQGQPTRDVKLITDEEAAAIYRQNYWAAACCDRLPWPTAMLQFDTAVNMGVVRAARFLQESLGVGVDGRIGNQTLAAIGSVDQGELALRYTATRESFYRSLAAQRPQMQKFLRGWLNRLNALRREAGLPVRESVDEDEEIGPTARVPEDTDAAPDAPVDLDDPAFAALDAAIARVERLASGPDAAPLAEAIAALRAALPPRPLPEPRTARLLGALRGARRFAEMREVAAALVASGSDRPSVRREYAQALIDSGEILPAIDMLGQLLAGRAAPVERAELAALLGRAWKQLFVQGGGAAALRNAVRCYESALGPASPGAPLRLWPAINLVALAIRARREGLDPGSPVDPLALARGILDAAPGAAEPWDLATMAEASIAVGNWPEAERFVRDYLRHPATDAFMVASTLRQLMEVWQIGGETGGAGRDVIAALRADLMQREGGAVTLTPAQIEDLGTVPRSTLQRVLGEPGTVTWEWMRTALARAAAVGSVRRPDGRAIGTCFLVRGGELDPRLGDGPVVVTNAHVLSATPADRPAVAPAEAEVVFEAAPGAPRSAVAGIVWSSAVEALDCCIARLAAPPAIAPLPLSGTPLPAPPPEGARPDPSQRLYIIGHPLGGQLAFSIHDNLLLDHEGPPEGQQSLAGRVLLHYRTPTEPGSSGSPVFDPVGWRVMALHHAGGLIMPRLNQRGGTYAANEGVWIGSIRAALARSLDTGG